MVWVWMSADLVAERSGMDPLITGPGLMWTTPDEWPGSSTQEPGPIIYKSDLALI